MSRMFIKVVKIRSRRDAALVYIGKLEYIGDRRSTNNKMDQLLTELFINQGR